MSECLQDRVFASSMSCLPSAFADFWAGIWEEYLRRRSYLASLGLWDDWGWIG